jgi:hypothetical protein
VPGDVLFAIGACFLALYALRLLLPAGRREAAIAAQAATAVR